jgi:UDP-N-acetylglucosamine 2-epimerase
METVWAGANVLAQPDVNLAEAVASGLASELSDDYANPYGNGDSSERIIDAIKAWLV